jgi:hypothetical protein
MGIINQIKRSRGGTSGRDRPADPVDFFHFNKKDPNILVIQRPKLIFCHITRIEKIQK